MISWSGCFRPGWSSWQKKPHHLMSDRKHKMGGSLDLSIPFKGTTSMNWLPPGVSRSSWRPHYLPIVQKNLKHKLLEPGAYYQHMTVTLKFTILQTHDFVSNYRISKVTVPAQQHLNPFKMMTLEPSTKTGSQHMRIKGGVQNYVATMIMFIRKASGKARARRIREFILVTWNCGWCFLSYSNIFVICFDAVMPWNEVTHSSSAFQIERKLIQTPMDHPWSS